MLHFFNPGHETAILNASPYYIAPENVLKMQHDLAYLPAWYGEPHDWVWVKDDFPFSFYDELILHFPEIPKPVNEKSTIFHKQQKLTCWGITPQALHYFEKPNQQHDLNLKIPEWREEFKTLTSRMSAKECLETLCNAIPEVSHLLVPKVFTTMDMIERYVLRQRRALLVKAPYSSSGRGLLWLRNGLGNKERDVLRGILKKQPFVTVEPIVQKEYDFSMQFFSDEDGTICFIGYSIFKTNEKGAYEKSFLHSQKEIEKFLVTFIPLPLLEKVKRELLLFLQKQYAPFYQGPISIDMMIYSNVNGFELHPCVEINMRYSMGFLAVQLFRRYFSPDSFGIFKIDYHNDSKQLNHFHATHKEAYPLQIKAGKIERGYLPLCPITPESRYCAYVIAE